MDHYNTPFGNSVYQIQNFTAGKETPERRYRHCLLQLSNKERAMKECVFNRRRIDIDIAELKDKKDLTIDKYEKLRLTIDIEEKEFNLNYEIKLIEDCAIEIKVYRDILSKLPKFTREEFENAEPVYWEKRLIADARREMLSAGNVSPQTIEALENIGFELGKNEQGQLVCNKENNHDIPHLS